MISPVARDWYVFYATCLCFSSCGYGFIAGLFFFLLLHGALSTGIIHESPSNDIFTFMRSGLLILMHVLTSSKNGVDNPPGGDTRVPGQRQENVPLCFLLHVMILVLVRGASETTFSVLFFYKMFWDEAHEVDTPFPFSSL